MTELYEIYPHLYAEVDEYHIFLTDMKLPFSYTKHSQVGMSSGGRFTVRSNALQKLRNFFSCRKANRHGDGEADEGQESMVEEFLQRTITEKSENPLLVDTVSAKKMNECENLSKIHEQKETANVTAREYKENKEVQMNPPGRGNLRMEKWRYQQFNDGGAASRIIKEEEKMPMLPPNSTLKRKRGTEDIGANKAGFDTYMEHLRAQQHAIREGKLEQVIRPGYAPPRKIKNSPPPPPKSQSPTPRFTTKRQKDKSLTSKIAPSKFTSYIASSADLLDTTRRDLTSNLIKSVEKLRPPLAGLDFHYVGILRRGNSADEDDYDDQSFSCIGVSETELRVSTPELEKARRISGEGLDPWTQLCGSRMECRMCHACCTGLGLGGLCRGCRRTFQRSTKPFDRRSQDETKLPVPLKMTKPSAEKLMSSIQEESHPSLTSSNDSERFIDHSASRTSAELGRAPSIASQHGKIGRVEVNSHTPQRRTEFISIYERWQTPEMRAEFAKREALRWSSTLLGREDTLTTGKGEAVPCK